MRSVFNRSLGAVGVLVALVGALLGAGFAIDVHAQAFYTKRVPLTFSRNSVGTDNPLASLGQAFYSTSIANGTHGTGTTGIAAVNPSLTDTSATIDLRDHVMRVLPIFRALADPVVTLKSDTMDVATLIVTSTSGTIDSVMILRDISQDGLNWTAVDSIGSHLQTGSTIITQAQAADSVTVTLSAVVSQAGTVGGRAAFTFAGSPHIVAAGVTALAFRNVNFWRFRTHMTSGDYAAAGAVGGLRMELQYPAIDANPNAPSRLITP